MPKQHTPALDPDAWRRLREETGHGVKVLAPMIGPDGVSYTTLSRWERGLLTPSGANRAAWWNALQTLIRRAKAARRKRRTS